MNLKPTFTTLNPYAPEYKPIPPGVIPHSNAPLPSFLPPPSSTAFQQPCPPPPPCFLPRQVYTYIPTISQSTQHPLHTNYNNPYYVTPQNPIIRNPPPPPRPRTPSQWGGGSTKQKGRLPAGDSSRNKAVKNGRGFFNNFKFEKRPVNCNEKNSAGVLRDAKFFTRSMHRYGKKDKVMPLKRDEEKTTVMIKNIPYDCPRKELISLIDVFCLLENAKARNHEGTSADQDNFISAYDFLYLPIDFRTKKSRGFAFVNFTNATTVWKFFQAFHQKNWDFIQRTTKWTKKIEVVTAKIQGKEALVNHFSESIFECETDEFLPLTFNPPRDGSGQPGQLTAIGSRRSTATISHQKPRHNHKP